MFYGILRRGSELRDKEQFMNEYEKMYGEKSAGEIAALKARIQDLMNELKLKD